MKSLSIKNDIKCNSKENTTNILVLSLIVVLSFFVMLRFGSYKSYMYEDEVLSYTGANNPGGLYYQLNDRTEYSGSDFLTPLTVQEGHAFDYITVRNNQSADTHPPYSM